MRKEFDPNIMCEKIIKVIKTIYDPEIPVDIYELGLIYDIMINENFDVKIIMTLTSPNCPVAETLPVDVEEKVKTVEGVKTSYYSSGSLYGHFVDTDVDLVLSSSQVYHRIVCLFFEELCSCSSRVFHSLHPLHFPVHLGLSCPQD